MRANILSLFIVLTVILSSCVSAKKYTESQTQLTQLKEESTKLSNSISTLNDKVNELTMRTLDLSRDSLRLYSDMMEQRDSYEEIVEEQRYEIARLSSQKEGRERQIIYSDKSANTVWDKTRKIYNTIFSSVKGISEEIKLILNPYSKEKYSIDTHNLALVVKLSDQLLFKEETIGGVKVYNREKLSASGVRVVNGLSALIKSKENYDIIVRESVDVKEPNIKRIPSGMLSDMNSVSIDAVIATLDKLIESNTLMYVLPEPIKVEPQDTLNMAPVPVIDVEEQNKLDSIAAVESANKQKAEHAKQIAKMINDKNIATKVEVDRTSIIINILMKECYEKLGYNNISKDVRYRKEVRSDKDKSFDGVEILFIPKSEELYKTIKR